MVVGLNVFLNEVKWAFNSLINHQRCRDAEQRVHAIATLKKGCKRSVWEMVLHLKEMDQLRHAAALLYDLLKIEVRVLDEFVDCFLVGKHTVFVCLTVLEHTEIWLSWHQ